ncbi:peptidase family c54 protein, putative [Ichthyophthirius multifiliis]|uniref:Cysteine protease n=1 Tax=Ichthyophthirius multifiliis TaxID=5932 RepID=G0R4Z0_ICHMU|nr:peptidase family c54 protein, putative [Ichthyophthirius multifiliis]EGR27474.1 peptidase family c54 protein, putative [Ichthyophthirius multifiliis]|eukprot:XP_004024384.1 peptidase family c54 protein, putative [Ichthyophthirius multifiliis]
MGLYDKSRLNDVSIRFKSSYKKLYCQKKIRVYKYYKLQSYFLFFLFLNFIGFLDYDDGLNKNISFFSIQKISALAYFYFDLKPQNWYDPNRICFILEKLYNFSSIKGTENLKFKYFSNHKLIFFEDLIKLMVDSQAKLCNQNIHNEQQQNLDLNNNSSQLIEDSFEVITKSSKQNTLDNLICKKCHQSDKSLLIFISCLTNTNKISNKKQQEVVISLLKNQFSIGMIGGVPGKAYYFLGIIDNDFIYLDPHYIQEAHQNEKTVQNIDTYFCKFINRVSQKKLESSLAFGFYIKNLQELEQFYQDIKNLEYFYKDDFFQVYKKKKKYQNKISVEFEIDQFGFQNVNNYDENQNYDSDQQDEQQQDIDYQEILNQLYLKFKQELKI